jgi:hypothetical protein
MPRRSVHTLDTPCDQGSAFGPRWYDLGGLGSLSPKGFVGFLQRLPPGQAEVFQEMRVIREIAQLPARPLPCSQDRRSDLRGMHEAAKRRASAANSVENAPTTTQVRYHHPRGCLVDPWSTAWR